jgi:hypothetical protein
MILNIPEALPSLCNRIAPSNGRSREGLNKSGKSHPLWLFPLSLSLSLSRFQAPTVPAMEHR